MTGSTIYEEEMMEEEDTIELIDLLRVVWKWKWMIIIFTLVCAIGAGVISYNLPEVYSISAVIEPGVIGINENGALIYVDDPSHVKSKIENMFFHLGLDIEEKKYIHKFKASNPKGSRIVKLTSECPSAKIDLCIKGMKPKFQISIF